jgi:hypothetical protein
MIFQVNANTEDGLIQIFCPLTVLS